MRLLQEGVSSFPEIRIWTKLRHEGCTEEQTFSTKCVRRQHAGLAHGNQHQASINTRLNLSAYLVEVPRSSSEVKFWAVRRTGLNPQARKNRKGAMLGGPGRQLGLSDPAGRARDGPDWKNKAACMAENRHLLDSPCVLCIIPAVPKLMCRSSGVELTVPFLCSLLWVLG